MKRFLGQRVRKHSLRAVIMVILVLLSGAVILSVLSSRNMGRIIREDFNDQQLQLARHAAGILGENFEILKRELTTLSLSPSIQYLEAVSWANRMNISFSSVRDYGVTRIILMEAQGKDAFSISYNNAVSVERVGVEDRDYFTWGQRPENEGKIFVSDTHGGIAEDPGQGFMKILAVPVYQISTDEAHPQSTHRFTGVLAFVLDIGIFVRKVVGPIRSGRTGYAWVIDEKGYFLYHLEEDFKGKNAFEVRKFKDSHISFSEINLIQKDRMLRGEEGTSWYISGWHRGVTGKVRKLIAYAPVHIAAANTKQIWSVAVVAPIGEVEDAVQSVYIRQSLLQGVIIVAVVIVLAVFIIMERVWLRSLEHMVEEKTRDLEEYAQRLRRSEEGYRSLIESADDMIYTLDEHCQILSVNDYYSRLIGKKAQEIVGRGVTDVIQYRHPEEIPEIVDTVMRTAKTIEHEEQAKIGGRTYWLDTKYKPVLKSDNLPSAVLVISRDVTEHKEMESRLFHTEKLASLGALSAGVAHEINNPIAIILGFTELLLDRIATASREYEMLKSIERQGNNCKRIVENLLAFARIPDQATTETDVVQELQKVLHMVTNTLLTRKVEIRMNMEKAIPRVRGDGQQLEQVFLNIINNAVAAMNGGGVLTISLHHTDQMVSISFSDTGHGIAPEYMDMIFEPFFTTKKVGEGTGLGLSVSYGIVKKLGGDIQVESQTAQGGKIPGTTFTISLPIAGEKASETEGHKA